MAKQKTKRIPFDSMATEVSPGVWHFDTGGVRWAYREGMGLNLAIVDTETNTVQPVCYVKKLDEAAIFAEGYSAGQHVLRQAQQGS